MTVCDCSKINHEAGAHFCRECGTQLKQKCIKCGYTSTFPLEFKFCCMCGTCQQPANAKEEKSIPALNHDIQKVNLERMKQLIQNGDLVFSWKPIGDLSGIESATLLQMKRNKYGIRENLLGGGVLFNFTIKNQKSFDFLSAFAEENGYPKPVWPHVPYYDIKNKEELPRGILFHIFPQDLNYQIREKDNDRVRKIWYDSKIMIDC